MHTKALPPTHTADSTDVESITMTSSAPIREDGRVDTAVAETFVAKRVFMTTIDAMNCNGIHVCSYSSSLFAENL